MWTAEALSVFSFFFILQLSPVWLGGLYFTWREAKKQAVRELRKLLKIWTHYCLLLSFFFFIIPRLFAFIFSPISVAFILLFFIVPCWVIGAIGALFIWTIRGEYKNS